MTSTTYIAFLAPDHERFTTHWKTITVCSNCEFCGDAEMLNGEEVCSICSAAWSPMEELAEVRTCPIHGEELMFSDELYEEYTDECSQCCEAEEAARK